MQLDRTVRIAPIHEKNLKMVKNSTGIRVIKYRGGFVPKCKDRAANGVAEVLPEKPFDILLYNFEDQERILPNGMVFSYSIKHLIALLPIGGELGHEISRCLLIEADLEKKGGGEEKQEEPNEGIVQTSAQDLEK